MNLMENDINKVKDNVRIFENLIEKSKEKRELILDNKKACLQKGIL